MVETPSELGLSVPAKKPRSFRRLLAGILSSALPGLGQFLIGSIGRGSIWLAFFVAFIALSAQLSEWNSPEGLLACLLISWTFGVSSGVDAAFMRVPLREKSPTKVAIVVFLAFAIVPMFFIQRVWNLAGFSSFRVPSTAMQPTIRIGDLIVVNRRAYRFHSPARDDIIVYRDGDNWVVKRVIGLPGDSILGQDGNVFLNGVRLGEPFAMHSRSTDVPVSQNYFGPLKLGAGDFFVMGDNRDFSRDSRVKGPVKMRAIAGRALYTCRAKMQCASLLVH